MNPAFTLDDGFEEIKKTLFKNAMESNWEEVIKTYKENTLSHTAKITSSGDTALHIAISNGEESIVETLVDDVHDTKGALETQNELGNTPLHLAAYLGNARLCECIAQRESKLMGIRNADNETPFFLAVRHGRKEAFQALHRICKEEEGYSYCRGKDGETILHSAIYGEYFDLAFEIMTHYKKLLNAVNEQGFSALHILANKPSAFRSGSQIRGLDKLIYHCIFVDELEDKNLHNKGTGFEYKKGAKYPANSHTCVTTFNVLCDVTRVLLGYSRKEHDEENIEEKNQKAETSKGRQQDENHPKSHQLIDKIMMVLCGSRKADAERHQFERGKQAEGSSKRINAQGHEFEGGKQAEGSSKRINAQGHEFLPKNYITFFNLIKLISKTMLVILGLGSKSVDKIKEKKTKHIWSIQIMDILLNHAKEYHYENNGKSPGIIPQGKDSDTPIPYTLPDIAADGTVAADFNQAIIDNTAHEDRGEPPEKSPNNKAGRDTLQCREMLCSALKSLGIVKDSASLDALFSDGKGGLALEMEKRETPILIAAKRGVVEMVAGILERFPVAIHDMNNEKKNVVLLAVEHRQPHVYKFLLDWKAMKDTTFRKTDKYGNSALHLAARLGEYRPWLIPGAALQMQWEIKWYEFVKNSMPHLFFPRYNNESKTPRDIFSQTHDALAREGGAWLTSTSQSCSVVAALIATVAFATSATVPGGVKDDNSGSPTLQNQPAFSIFAISSLVALCFSVTSVVMFLAILTSRFQEKDFGKDLPRKLLVGLTSLFVSIGSMLLSFCAGHFFVLKEKLQYAAFPMYAITCLPVTFFAIAQFPLYFDLVWATIRKVPQRSSK